MKWQNIMIRLMKLSSLLVLCLLVCPACVSHSPIAIQNCKHVNAPHEKYKCNAVWDKVFFHDDIDFALGHFRVVTSGGTTGVAPANIPVDAIRYGVTDFMKVRKGYNYFDRIIIATQKGLALNGKAAVFISYSTNEYINFTVYYNYKVKHLMFVEENGLLDKKLYSVDLSDVDVRLN